MGFAPRHLGPQLGRLISHRCGLGGRQGWLSWTHGQVPSCGLLCGLGCLTTWWVDLSVLASEAFLHHLPMARVRQGQASSCPRSKGRQETSFW